VLRNNAAASVTKLLEGENVLELLFVGRICVAVPHVHFSKGGGGIPTMIHEEKNMMIE
jgi:hypothetical protein